MDTKSGSKEERNAVHAENGTFQFTWVVTLQWIMSGGHGWSTATRSGLITAGSDCTLHNMYAHVYKTAVEQCGNPPDAVVLFSSITPNLTASEIMKGAMR